MSYSGRESTSVTSAGREGRVDMSSTKEETVSGEPKQLRRKRSAAKGAITKKIKELTELKTGWQSLSEANVRAQEFTDVVNKFYTAHEHYHTTIEDNYDREDSNEYLQIEVQRIQNFQKTLSEWLANFTVEQPTLELEVEPGDSASNVECKSRSKARNSMISSQRSLAKSTRSNMAIAAAKKAALVAEAAAFKEHQALEEQELSLKYEKLAQQRRHNEEKLRLKQRKHQLRLETEIAKAEAEEKAYATVETLGNYDDLPSQLHNPVSVTRNGINFNLN